MSFHDSSLFPSVGSDTFTTPFAHLPDNRLMLHDDENSDSLQSNQPFGLKCDPSPPQYTHGHLSPLHSVNMQNFEDTSLEMNPFASSFSTFTSHVQPFPIQDDIFSSEYPTTSCLQDFSDSHADLLASKTSDASSRRASLYNPRFPEGHRLRTDFVRTYALGGELGAGGYGFVMTATHRVGGYQVAIKFIIKAKIPSHAWTDDEYFGCRIPTEVSLLHAMDHPNIVGFLDLFQDPIYYYLVQELHGSPWSKFQKPRRGSIPPPEQPLSPDAMSPPCLSPSASEDSIADSDIENSPIQRHIFHPPNTNLSHPTRPTFSKIPSHDLFECIEQSANKRLSEATARYVFSQVVEAVYYLDQFNVSHRDIKDENILVDRHYKVVLIDFGSAICEEEPRGYHNTFYGTTAYAASEILQKKRYLAAPAEIWTLGVLLSYLLCGRSPFPSEQDAIKGRIVLTDTPGSRLSRSALSLMRQCCEPDPSKRATIAQVRSHPWLHETSP